MAATGADEVRALEATAGLAARIVAELVGPGDVIGIAGGSTLAAVVEAVPRRSDPTLKVIQIAGSSSRLGPSVDPAAVSRQLAERLGAAHRPLFAPATVDDAAVRAALVRRPDIAATIATLDELSTALVGIGTLADRAAAAAVLEAPGAEAVLGAPQPERDR
ncbi:MAG: transcriptional regulator [Chloroflexi bacterium CSP1-4]|nr:MAG: transcriptional regulator [Chloroflexi bacterium CSP1-4]